MLRASLIRRLTLAFIVGHAIALFAFLVALLPLARDDDTDQIGPEVVVAMLREDIVNKGNGLALRRDSDFERFAEANPKLWFVARKGKWSLQRGRVPPEAIRSLEILPAVTISATFGNIGSAGREGDMIVARSDANPSSLVIAAGGVKASEVTIGVWLSYLNRELYTLLPIGSALFSLLGALIAIPLVMQTVRPTLREVAALDPANPAQRLSESRVVSELLPLIQAFNAALERIEADLSRRRRFIADVAHELRTPLAVLTMHTDVLQDSRTKIDLQRTVFRLGQMVGQMLDSERLALSTRCHEPVDLVALSKSAVAEIAPLALASGYDIDFHAKLDRVLVMADSHAALRALLNLLGNAVSHGGNRGVINVHVMQSGAVTISDEGPGVPLDARARIFEPFSRERWDRDGCGLGLHLVREIMTAHGGDVDLVSGGPGAVFRLQFKLVVGSETA